MNEKLRMIEISEGCMGGGSAIYLTDATDKAIENAIRLYRDFDNDTSFDALEKEYTMIVIISSEDTCFYQEAKEKINLDKTFEIYE